MQTLIFSFLFFILSLLLSCANTKNKAAKNNSGLSQSQNSEALVEVETEEIASLEDQYLSEEIYLSIKSDSGIKLDVGSERINQLSKSPLSTLHESYKIVEITKPMLALKPNLYRLTFTEGTDLQEVIATLQPYPFVEYAELIPINK